MRVLCLTCVLNTRAVVATRYPGVYYEYNSKNYTAVAAPLTVLITYGMMPDIIHMIG